MGGQLHKPPDRVLAEVASRQHGVVARRQLVALGLTRDAIDGRVARCVLLPLYRGVYALGHKALSMKGRWMAAVLACGPDAVLSHRDAAALWGVRRVSGTRIDVTAPKRSHATRGITLHRAKLAPKDRSTRDNIPTTSLARTLLDLAALNLQLCANAGLPMPQVSARLGAYEVDALWSEQRLVVELDAYGTHGSRRSFESDRIRDSTLLEAGYRTLRITGLRLEREPEAVGRAIERLLG